MRTFKLVFGLLAALLPVVYCGGLFWYFSGVGGSMENATSLGLGPTMIGLGGIGVLLCIPVILKLVKIAGGARAPVKAGGSEPAADEPAFDADAALARYMARKAAGTEVPPPVFPGEGVERRATFGRRIG